MVKDPEVAGYDLVLEDSSGRNINPVPVVRDDDHRSLEVNILSYFIDRDHEIHADPETLNKSKTSKL